jgi:hypothetical protein
MNTTGIFTVHQFTIPSEKSREPIHVIPFGDVHKFAPLHSTHHWESFLGWAREHERCYFIGMGDYMDLASASERNILRDRRIHESSIKTLEELYDSHLEQFYRDIGFMKGKMIGMMEGNHYGEYASGITSTQKMCEMFGCKYLGASAFIRITILYKDVKHASIDVWAHHGRGAARLVGGSLNRVAQMGEQAEADIFLMGHDHRKSAGTTSRLRLAGGGGGLKVVHRKQLYIRTGSFLRGYVNGQPSYVADMNLNPADLGVVKITIVPTKTHDGFELDLSASI